MRVNQMLGDYKLLELIGKGGQGKVYKALDMNLRRTVAVKVFVAKNENRRKKLARFKYEARLASALNHPNICTVYGLFEDEIHTSIIMEYIDGRNLYEFAYRKPLEIKRALEITIQLTDALIAAHRQGIIHRDIKPRNVMVTDEGRVIVLDFGSAKLIEESDGSFDFDEERSFLDEDTDEGFVEDLAEDLFTTVDGLPYGTPASSPPEMALGKPADHRSDVFSTGVLLYLLLTGDFPFDARTKVEVRRKIVSEEPLPVSAVRQIPTSLDAIVNQALCKDPGGRFQTMFQMRAKLREVLMETEQDSIDETAHCLSVDAAETYYGPPSKKSRRKLPVTIWASVALIVIAVLVFYFLYISL